MLKMKKVIFLNSCVSGGGAGQSLKTYLRHKSDDIQATLIVPKESELIQACKPYLKGGLFLVPEFVERIQKSHLSVMQGVKFRWMHVLVNVAVLCVAAFKIYRICKKIKPDIIYANHMLANPLALLVGYILGVDVFFHQRNIHDYIFEKQIYRWMGARWPVKKIICNSYASAQLFLEQSKDKTHVVYNCVDDALFLDPPPPVKKSEAMTFGYVGRIVPIKGVDVFMRASFEIMHTYQHMKMMVVGGNDPGLHTDLLGSYQAQAKEVGLDTRSTFTGYQADIRPFLRDMDVLVMPTLWPEPFGRVLIEAMSQGAICIVSAWGGAVEVVEDGVNGFWYMHEEELNEKMQWCLDHPDQVGEMGKRARKSVETHFRASTNSVAMDELIRDSAVRFAEEEVFHLENANKAQAFARDRQGAFLKFRHQGRIGSAGKGCEK